MITTIERRLKGHLQALYGTERLPEIWSRLEESLAAFQAQHPGLIGTSPFQTINDLETLLITYADQIQTDDQPHLVTLAAFFKKHLSQLISGLHLLPFFPYSSDDGFSVINYRQVDPSLGTWGDLQPLRDCCLLMFDAVINHISRESAWFEGYCQGDPKYQDYFIHVDPEADLSQVVRPRVKPLLTEVETVRGKEFVWTTFSPDQIDLNYQNPEVLLEIIDLLLFYVSQGARIIRLDAIAYLWKEIGTPCIHLPETHRVVKILRAVLDLVAPSVLLITETNVPHEENISYFGTQLPSDHSSQTLGDEAQMVYQFPLAPLVLHTFRAQDSTKLSTWASSLKLPFQSATFLNFIASHDGIGVRPAEGLLTAEEIQGLVEQTIAHGGQVSYKSNPDGSQSVYELNITLYDALNPPSETDLELGVARFIASQAIMLSLAGVPGIYFHSLFGSRNSQEDVQKTGRARSINREKFSLDELDGLLQDPTSRAHQVFRGFAHLIAVRQTQAAFHPLAPQTVLQPHPAFFALRRSEPKGEGAVLCLTNITDRAQTLALQTLNITRSLDRDLLSGEQRSELLSENILSFAPYQVRWLSLV